MPVNNRKCAADIALASGKVDGAMSEEVFCPVAVATLVPAGSGAYPSTPAADPLPRFPSMIATRLQLELLLQDSSVDLTAVSQVILADAGATLEVLRMVGEEYANVEDRPTRIEDCIVSLSTQQWFGAVCASGVLHSGPLVSEWHQCRRIAECARELAQHFEGISPDEAYLVGLLYRLGRFPRLMGWNAGAESIGENRALGRMLADFWHLPGYLLNAINELQEQSTTSRWSDLLQTATELAHMSENESASS